MVTVREWKERYADGDFDAKDRNVQVEAGWFDWKCDDLMLAAKTKKLAGFITRLKDGGKLDLDALRVSFVNAEPDGGSPHDEVRFSDAEGLVWRATLNESRFKDADGKNWHAFDVRDVGTGEPVFACDTVVQLARWFNEPVPTNDESTFQIKAGFTTPELAAAVAADSLENFGVEVVLKTVQKKYFRSRREALAWLSGQLPVAEQGAILVVVYGDDATVGYTVEPQ